MSNPREMLNSCRVAVLAENDKTEKLSSDIHVSKYQRTSQGTPNCIVLQYYSELQSGRVADEEMSISARV